jgi:hypothetical protein
MVKLDEYVIIFFLSKKSYNFIISSFIYFIFKAVILGKIAIGEFKPPSQ